MLLSWLRARCVIVPQSHFLVCGNRFIIPRLNLSNSIGLKRSREINAFTLTLQQWIKGTDAIGIISKSGRYGGTYTYTDIAFEFASWISPEFKLYIIGNKRKTPNIRDFASAEELVVLINLEDTNADLIRQGLSDIERLKILREKAYRQLQTPAHSIEKE